MKRYLGEFNFRYNERKITDGERMEKALKGIEGKCLTYRRIGGLVKGQAPKRVFARRQWLAYLAQTFKTDSN